MILGDTPGPIISLGDFKTYTVKRSILGNPKLTWVATVAMVEKNLLVDTLHTQRGAIKFDERFLAVDVFKCKVLVLQTAFVNHNLVSVMATSIVTLQTPFALNRLFLPIIARLPP